MASRSGGGINSNKVVHRSHGKTEPRARAINPSATNYLGNHVGDHVTHSGKSTGYRGELLVRGPGYNAPLGISDPVKAVGVGGGRTIYKTGSQDQQGNVAGSRAPQGRDTLAEYGPESSRER